MKRKWGPILEGKLGSFYQSIFLYSTYSTSNAHFSFEQFSLVSVIFFLNHVPGLTHNFLVCESGPVRDKLKPLWNHPTLVKGRKRLKYLTNRFAKRVMPTFTGSCSSSACVSICISAFYSQSRVYQKSSCLFMFANEIFLRWCNTEILFKILVELIFEILHQANTLLLK
jgi:hypothetical protein